MPLCPYAPYAPSAPVCASYFLQSRGVGSAKETPSRGGRRRRMNVRRLSPIVLANWNTENSEFHRETGWSGSAS